jgi:hypothetical protein
MAKASMKFSTLFKKNHVHLQLLFLSKICNYVNAFKSIMKNILLYMFFLLLTACGRPVDNPYPAIHIDKNRLVNINKYLINKDMDIIRHFVKRKSWRMTLSDNGYFYELFNEGEQPKIMDKQLVTYDCKIMLLDGTLCYELKNKSFVIGASEEIYGLHHAIKLMGKGGKARFIFPPNLAYGNLGNFDRIPPRATLLYEIHVTNLLN